MHDRPDLRAAILGELASRLRARNILPDEVGGDFHFLDSGVLDSFALVGFLSTLEKRLGITIDFSDVDPQMLMTMSGLIRTIAPFVPAA